MIEHPLPDCDAWVLFYTNAELPVMRLTANALDKLRDDAENVNGRVLSSVMLHDPLMALRVLAYLTEHRRESQKTDVTTIERALMMIGVGPFFRDFNNLPLVEDQLKSQPKALLGLIKVIARSRKAARWAREWAVHRHDLDADEITLAALLHDVAEILMWCFAPKLALSVEEMKTKDHSMRSASAQLDVYGTTLLELQQALVHFWGLPKLLTMLMDHSTADNPRVKNVALAVDLARHSSNGWDDPALPDDLRAIKELLHVSDDLLLQKLGLEPDSIPWLTAPPEQNT